MNVEDEPVAQAHWLRKPSTTGGIIYLAVVAATVVGVGIATAGAPRVGSFVLAAAFGFAALSRAVLPDERAGMLRIRRRFVDITTMGVCSVGMLVLGVLITGPV